MLLFAKLFSYATLSLWTDFSSPNSDFQFFTIPIHTSPEYAVSEIDALADVFDDAVQKFSEPNGLVMGVSAFLQNWLQFDTYVRPFIFILNQYYKPIYGLFCG